MEYIENAQMILKTLRFFMPASHVAELLKVTSPTYKRWEAGSPVPAVHRKAFDDALLWLETHVRGTAISVDMMEIKVSPHKLTPTALWLQEQLEKRPTSRSLLVARAKKKGISPSSLRKAAIALEVKSKVEGFGRERTATWSL